MFSGLQAELLSESLSLGDLCHTKALLTLPIKSVPVDTVEINITPENQAATMEALESLSSSYADDKNPIISTTPSCTGSMDSLSSSSGSSERQQISFTTFGKRNPIYEDNHLNEQDLIRPSLILTENENILDVVVVDGSATVIKSTKHDRSTKQNDSTDEDSGIESIMRIGKENV